MIKIEDVKEICEGLFDTAIQTIEQRQEEVAPVAFIFREDTEGIELGIVEIPEFTDVMKTMLPFALRKIAVKTNADVIAFMSEAWALSAEKQQPNKLVSEHDERYGALFMIAQVKGGETLALWAKVNTESGVRSVSKPSEWSDSAGTSLVLDWAGNKIVH